MSWFENIPILQSTQSFKIFTFGFDIFHADGVVLDVLCDRLVLKDKMISVNML